MFGVALLYMRGFWSGYAQHREQIASAERLMVPPLCLLLTLMEGPTGWTALAISPYTWALWGLVYFSVFRRVRWRVHMTLLLAEACTRATAAIAASLCIHRELTAGAPLLTCMKVVWKTWQFFCRASAVDCCQVIVGSCDILKQF